MKIYTRLSRLLPQHIDAHAFYIGLHSTVPYIQRPETKDLNLTTVYKYIVLNLSEYK